MVFPTIAEGCGLPLLEALALGAPGCITATANLNAAAIAEVIRLARAGKPEAAEARHVEVKAFRLLLQDYAPIPAQKRLLALSTGDYQASSGRDLKYAQSYTLVHFLLHGDERAHREGFLEFLRSLYQGKGSATDLKRCLKADWRKLGASWQAYVKTHG